MHKGSDRTAFPIPADVSDRQFLESIIENVKSAMHESNDSWEEKVFGLDEYCKEKLLEWLNVYSANILSMGSET